MESILKQMLDEHTIDNDLDRRNALKEVIQEIILCGLSRADFF